MSQLLYYEHLVHGLSERPRDGHRFLNVRSFFAEKGAVQKKTHRWRKEMNRSELNKKIVFLKTNYLKLFKQT